MDEIIAPGAQPSQESGAGLLGALLSNPEWMGRMQNLLSSALSAAEKKPSGSDEGIPTPPPTESQEPSAPASNPMGNDGLAKLLSDPALLAGLPQIIATVKPLLSSLSIPTSAVPSKEASPKSIPVCRDNLLLALKPFLSPKRCQAVDSMLRIAKLGEILGQLK